MLITITHTLLNIN